ncbi:MAG: methylthioribulose 1-phosphate dehydratase, partial [Oleiphilaceae bacterium]|nr:methylthioribulose 1-phosphate dehydratase [Oleiphilaceae bacterium]
PQDFIPMSLEGNHRAGFEAVKSSAETGIHLMLYQQRDCKVILHTHSKADTLISRVYHAAKQIELEGYELLKGLRDIDTHESQTIVPIFDNDQDISRLSGEMKRWLEQHPDCQGLLIERHGFYCWGRDLAEAKRHLEVFQFLFDQELEWLKLSALK